MADEESGAAADIGVVVAVDEKNDKEEQPDVSTTNNDDAYTAVAFPGCEVFSSWLGRAEEDLIKDASLDTFMGRYYKVEEDDTAEGGDIAAAADSTTQKEEIHANYELYDTPVWRARKRELIAKKMEELEKKPTRCCSRNKTTDVEVAMHELEKIRRYGSRILVIMVGVGMALLGYAIVSAADALHDVKINYAQTFMPDYVKGFGVHVGVSLMYITIAYIPVAYRPIVAGSGIDYAKAMLNGITVPECSSLITMFCKGVGIVFTSAASLPVGLEGPMIHSGLCLGANAWRIVPKNVASFDTLFSDRSRRDFAAIGTSAAVAGKDVLTIEYHARSILFVATNS